MNDQDDHQWKESVGIIARINESMHEIHEKFIQNQSDKDVSYGGSVPARAGNFIDVDSLPLPSPVVQRRMVDANQTARTKQESPPSGSSIAKNARTVMGSCPSHETQFRIWFDYSQQDTYLMVWESMPLQALFAFSQKWLKVEFQEAVSSDDIILLLTTSQDEIPTFIPDDGILGDVPLIENDILLIQVRGYEDTKRNRSSSSKPSPRDDLFQSDLGKVPIFAKSEDTKSYDKIKQNFKCPKFSGQGKDWKLWDKGFMRFLSIWDLDRACY